LRGPEAAAARGSGGVAPGPFVHPSEACKHP
jgi:hypothetical protein